MAQESPIDALKRAAAAHAAIIDAARQASDEVAAERAKADAHATAAETTKPDHAA